MEILQHNVFEPWPIEDKSVQAIITSPPYWSLRCYEISDIVIGGKQDCEHEFEIINHPPKGGHTKPDNMPIGHNLAEQTEGISIRFGYQSNQCIKCNAWKGQYGLEPSYGGMIELETDEVQLRDDLSEKERKYVIAELVKRGLIA